MDMKSGNAGAVIFGFQFQIDAAICLFIRNIKNISIMKVEGRFQDVEFYLNNNSIIYCQVKSIHNPKTTKKNHNKLIEAIKSLVKCKLNHGDVLMFCSNQFEPLISDDLIFNNDSILEYSYSDLNNNSRELIKRYFNKHLSSNYNKLSIVKIPYRISSNIDTKRVFIIDEVKKFLQKINEGDWRASSLVSLWHDTLENSATSTEGKFYVSKSEFVWIIIAHLLDQKTSEIIDYIDDESLLEDIERKYKSLIHNKINNFEASNYIIGLYKEQFHSGKCSNIEMFIENNHDDLCKAIYLDDDVGYVENITLFAIVKIILRTRTRIERIKEEANI